MRRVTRGTQKTMEANRVRAPDPAPAASGSAPEPAARSEESFLINLAALAAGIASVGWLAGDNRWQRLAEVVEYPAIVPCAVVFAGVAAGQMLRRGAAGAS